MKVIAHKSQGSHFSVHMAAGFDPNDPRFIATIMIRRHFNFNESSIAISQAFVTGEGASAARRLGVRTANPYRTDTPNHACWQVGYDLCMSSIARKQEERVAEFRVREARKRAKQERNKLNRQERGQRDSAKARGK